MKAFWNAVKKLGLGGYLSAKKAAYLYVKNFDMTRLDGPGKREAVAKAIKEAVKKATGISVPDYIIYYFLEMAVSRLRAEQGK